jgi:hypothetical protein
MRRVLVLALIVAVPLLCSQPAWAQTPAAQPTTEQVARTALTERLVKLGLTQEESESRVRQLSNQEVIQLAEKPEQVGMGGIQDKTLIIIAVILIIPSVLLLLMI